MTIASPAQAVRLRTPAARPIPTTEHEHRGTHVQHNEGKLMKEPELGTCGIDPRQAAAQDASLSG